MNKVLELKDVTFGYTSSMIFKGASFDIEKGKFVALIGPNGVGKSTLIKIILGELKPNSGEVITNFDSVIGYVPQLGASISNNFPITVKEIVALNLIGNLHRFSAIDEDSTKKIKSTLKLVGLEGKINELFGNLSGGEKQKVMISKALIRNPELLVLDEPMIGLDEFSRGNLLDMLSHFTRFHGVTVLMITHDVEETKIYADEIYSIKDKRVVEINV